MCPFQKSGVGALISFRIVKDYVRKQVWKQKTEKKEMQVQWKAWSYAQYAGERERDRENTENYMLGVGGRLCEKGSHNVLFAEEICSREMWSNRTYTHRERETHTENYIQKTLTQYSIHVCVQCTRFIQVLTRTDRSTITLQCSLRAPTLTPKYIPRGISFLASSRFSCTEPA